MNNLKKLVICLFVVLLATSIIDGKTIQVKASESNVTRVESDVPIYTTEDFEKLDPSIYRSDRINIKIKQTTSRSFSIMGFSILQSSSIGFESYGISNLIPIQNTVTQTGKSSISSIEDSTKWYTAILNIGSDPINVIEALSSDPRVVIAEPDYYRYIDSSSTPTEITDPGMVDQWYLDAINTQDAWDYLASQGVNPGGSRDVIVAVIDTGVDYNHPDLHANMWVNALEIPNNGIDDDGNGYVDDYLGYDAITNDKDPMDDHGHGTHVAGIIGMQANNGIGGTGIAYNVQVMAIKAGQSSGVFSTSDIAKAIYYAVDNGADVINMSFGGYSRSTLESDALQVAFGTSALVAAAGNDGACNEGRYCKAMYPAANNWVIGVMAETQTGGRAGFSNYDSNYENEIEYEVYAPGVSIYSTLPNNKYAKWSGTSMAAPIISAIAALIRSKYPDKSTYTSRLIMGQIVSTGDSYIVKTSVDALSALSTSPKPKIKLLNYYTFDNLSNENSNNDDGIVDAGETIDLGVLIRNHWGQASNVVVSIDTISSAEVSDPYVEIIKSSVEYGTVGSFGTDDNGFYYINDVISGVDNPLTLKIANNTPNDHQININVTITYKNGLDLTDLQIYKNTSIITLGVRSGISLPSVISSNMTLTKDTLWIVDRPTLIEKNVTVTAEPGTKIQFYSTVTHDPYAEVLIPYISVEGSLVFIGTEDETIDITSSLSYEGHAVKISGQNVVLQYVTISDPQIYAKEIDHCYFYQTFIDRMYTLVKSGVKMVSGLAAPSVSVPVTSTISNTIFKNLGYYYNSTSFALSFNGNTNGNLYDNNVFDTGINNDKIQSFENNVYLRNYKTYKPVYGDLQTWTSKIYIYGAEFNKDYSMRVTSYEKNESTGITYLVIRPSLLTRYSIFPTRSAKEEIEAVEKFAIALGGHIATINNEDENNFVFNFLKSDPTFQSALAAIGYNDLANANEFSWISGESSIYTNWDITDFKTGVGYPMSIKGVAVYSSASLNPTWSFNSNTSQCYVLEIPNGSEVVNDAYIIEKKSDFFNNYVGAFTNNAILNVWEIPGTSHWLKFQANVARNELLYLTNNFWGVSSQIIERAITDYTDDWSLGTIHYEPLLDVAPETAFPFVVEAFLSTSTEAKATKVGSESVTVHVKFNRDMDTNIQPQVSYGPAMPYTDYTVYGDWVDARNWESTVKISEVASDGYQYFRVTGAVAADDPWLVTGNDYERFRFEIITQGAESLNLQATGEEGKVSLMWTQNDFDLLAGYNLYRSSTIDGTYTKINTTLIPSDQKNFSDTNINPGQDYYYKFTVVQTDFTESGFSNTAMGTPLDTIPPAIIHNPIRGASPGVSLSFITDVTDNVGVSKVELYYRLSGTNTFSSREMTRTTENRYVLTIEGSLIQSPGLEYYIQATDGYSVSRSGSMSVPYQIVITDAPKISSITPFEGPTGGGTLVYIMGANFKGGAQVYFGNDAGYDVNVISSTYIVVTTPAHYPANVDVTVTNPDNYSTTYLNGYQYVGVTTEVSLPTMQAYKGYTIEVPLSVDKVTDLLAASFTINYDSEILKFTGIRKGTITSGFALAYNANTLGTLNVSLASASSVSGSGNVLYLQFEVLETTKTSTILEISKAELNDGSIATTLVNGSFTIAPGYQLNGNIHYYSTNEAVSGVDLILSGLKSYSVSSNNQGAFTLSGIEEGSYSLSANKSSEVNGVTAYDAALALQSEVGLISLSTYQTIAADVNNNARVTAMDASYILQKSVGLLPGNYPGSGKVWTFSPSAISYPNINSNLRNQDLIAILLGDVSGNWIFESTVIQSISDVEIKTGYRKYDFLNNESRIDINFNPMSENIIALDLVIEYNPNLCSYKNIVKGTQLDGSMVLVNSSSPGILRIGISGTTALTLDNLFTLVFTYTNPLNISITSALANEQSISGINTEPLIGFTLDKSSVDFITSTQTAQINVTTNPLNATYKGVVWSTSNASIATVSASGLITPVSNGNATITATSLDGGYQQTVSVTVEFDLSAPIVSGVNDLEAYNLNKTISFNEGSATLNGNSFASGSTVSAEGTYILVVTDLASNVTTIHFIIDKTLPIITGVSEGIYYQSNKTISFNEGIATLDSISYSTGTVVSSEGYHTISVTDKAGNTSTVHFTIDKTSPIVSGVTNASYYNSNKIITFNEGTATLDTFAFSSGSSVSSEGLHTMIVADLAGNSTTVQFTIDKTSPVISGASNNSYYNTNKTIAFNEGSATLEGQAFVSGTTLSIEKTYTIIVTDAAGNIATLTFTIDKSAPEVSGVMNNGLYNSNRIITFNEGAATLDGSAFVSGSTVSIEGNHTLVVTDLVNQSITIKFTLDKTAPVITVDPYIQYPTNQNIKVNASCNEGTLNATSHIFTENGSFKFSVTDLAGNLSESTVTITNIDKVKPIVEGVVQDGIYNHSVTLTFNEGAAVVNWSTPFVSGGVISTEGYHNIIVTDAAGNQTIVTYTIDYAAPNVSGVYDGAFYNSDKRITFSDGTATLDGVPFTYGTTVTEEKEYLLIVTDAAGNKTTITFTIDKTKPIVSGATDGGIYNHPITIIFDDGLGEYNWYHSFDSGTEFSLEGTYYISVTDIAGNATYISFTLDYTAPTLSGINDGDSFNVDKTLYFTGGTGTINGELLLSGDKITEEGTYVVVLTDTAGNSSQTTFMIDKTAPIISGLDLSKYLYKTPIITFNEGTATLDYISFTSGNIVSTVGNHTITVTDKAGNQTTKTFTIIQTLAVPYITGSSVISYNTINFSWSSVNQADGYEIYQSTTSTGVYSKLGNSTSTSYLYTGAPFNTSYFYKVRGYVTIDGTTLYGEFSTAVSVKTALNAVSSLEVKYSSYNTNALIWAAVSGASGYEIYRSIGTSTTYALLKSVTGASTTDTLLLTNTKYNYKVRAYRLVSTTKVYGSYSPVISSTPLPSEPVVTAVSTGYNSLKITWPVVSGANGYEVSYSTSENGTYIKLALLTTTSASIGSLITNQTYFIKVKAYRIVGTTKIYGASSTLVSATPIPSSPVLSAVSFSYNSIKLSWAAISGASGYEVYRLDSDTYSLILDTALLTMTDSSLITGVNSTYKIKSYRMVGSTKVYSLDSTAVTSKAIPTTVTGLVTGSLKYTELSLSWGTVVGATGYEISRSSTLTGTYNVLGTVEGALSYTNTALLFNTTYYYKVRPYTTVDGVKVYGLSTSAVSGKTTLESVLGQTSVYTSYNSNKISWNAVIGASGYEIYRSIGTSTTYALLTTTTALTYSNSALLTNTKYNYKIRAYRLVGTTKIYGPFSSVVSSTPLPWNPVIIVASSGYNSLKITWPVIAGANGYEVSYSPTENGVYTKLALVTTNSASISGLLTNSTYYVKVRAYRIVGTTKIYGASSLIISGKPIPSTPVLSTVSAGYDRITITWPAVSGVSGYELSVLNPETSEYDLLNDTNVVTYTHTGLISGQVQSYRIKAYRLVDGVKVYSSESLVKTGTPIPSLVTGFKVAMPSVSSLKLSWTSVSGATGYEIFKSSTATGTYLTIGTIEGSTEYVVSSLAFNATMYYKIRAYTTVEGIKIYGLYSASISGKTIPSTVALTVSNPSYNSNLLTWEASVGASGYEIYFSTGTSTTYILLKSLTLTTFTHTTLVYNTQYNYKVRAFKLSGTTKIYGAYSSLISSRTLVSAPNPSTSYTHDSVTISWPTVLGASGYEVSSSSSVSGPYTVVLQTTLTKTYTGLVTGSTYYYKVRAYRLVGTIKVYGSYSSVMTVTPILGKPVLSLVALTTDTAEVNWTSISGATSYSVSIISNETDTSWITFTTTRLNVSFSELDPALTYTIKIKAIKNLGLSDVFSEYSDDLVFSYSLTS